MAELTTLEQHALLAALRLHPNGYGVTIRDEIERHFGRAPSFASVYGALDRLVAKGYLDTWIGEHTAERGGKRKLHFVITAPGQTTLRRMLQNLDAMRSGTELEGAFGGTEPEGAFA